MGLMDDDVGGHKRRIGEEPGVDVVGLLADLLLERSAALKLTYVGVHVQEQVQLGGLRNVALDIQGGLFRVHPAGQVFRKHLLNIPVQVHRSGVGGQGMIIRNEEEALVLMLHLDKIPECTKVVSKVQVPGRPDSAYDCIHGGKGRKISWTVGGWTVGQ